MPDDDDERASVPGRRAKTPTLLRLLPLPPMLCRLACRSGRLSVADDYCARCVACRRLGASSRRIGYALLQDAIDFDRCIIFDVDVWRKMFSCHDFIIVEASYRPESPRKLW